MAIRRPLQGNMDIRKSFNFEDGVAYRGHHQDMAPVIKHVEFMRHKVNEAPKSGNRGDWHYAGSITPVQLVAFLDEQTRELGFPVYMEHIARNEFGLRDKLKRQFLESREWSKLSASHSTTKPGMSSVVVPKDLQRQAADVDIGG